MNLKKIGGSVLAAALLATGLAVVAAPAGASAHTPTVTATCSTLTVDAEYYSAAVPATEGNPGQPYIAATPGSPEIPATPGQPYIAATPGTPAIPGTPPVPATYVQEFKFVFKGYGQHGGDKFEWHPADWFSQGWQKTGEHRDSSTVLTPAIPGTPDVPAVPGTPGQPFIAATPEVPAVPATEGQEFIPATPGTPAKTNHVTVSIDGATRVDEDFSTTYRGSWQFGDQSTGHTYRVVIASWDGIGNLDTGNVETAACIPPVVVKVLATVSVDNCLYSPDGVPTDRATVLTYDNSGSNTEVKFTVKGFPKFDRTVLPGAVVQVEVPYQAFQSGVLTVTAGDQTFALNVPPCVLPPTKPAPITTVTSNTVTDCTTGLDTTTTVTTTINWYLTLQDDGKLVWEQNTEQPVITKDVTTAKATEKECPPAVVPPVVVPPITLPSAPPAPVTVTSVHSSPAPTAATLAETGRNIPDWILWTVFIALALGVALLIDTVRRNARRE